MSGSRGKGTFLSIVAIAPIAMKVKASSLMRQV